MGKGPANETGLVAAIRRELNKAYPDHWSIKTHGNPYQDAGLPDLLICVEGLLIGMEVKFLRPGETREHATGRITPQQKNQLQKINEAGGMADMVISTEEALELIVRGFIKQRHLVAQRERELAGDDDDSTGG